MSKPKSASVRDSRFQEKRFSLTTGTGRVIDKSPCSPFPNLSGLGEGKPAICRNCEAHAFHSWFGSPFTELQITGTVSPRGTQLVYAFLTQSQVDLRFLQTKFRLNVNINYKLSLARELFLSEEVFRVPLKEKKITVS